MKKQKRDIRKKINSKLAKLSINRINQATQEINKFLQTKIEIKHGLRILSFDPMLQKNEINLNPINDHIILNKNHQLLLPRINPITDQIDCHLITYQGNQDWHDQLILNSYGIREPDPTIHPLVDPKSIDMIFVPGVAFSYHHLSKCFVRLGRGKGYYDNLLARIRSDCLTVGVGFLEQYYDQEIPIESHDRFIKQMYLF